MSTAVYSIRIPRKLKETIEKLEDVNWQEEVKAFLEQKVKEHYLQRELEAARKVGAQMKQTVDSAEIIRADREHAH